MIFLLLHYYENQRSMRCFSIASESGALDLADVMGRGRTAIVQYIGTTNCYTSCLLFYRSPETHIREKSL